MNTPQIAQTGTLDLIMAAGPVVKLVLLLLLSASVFSWAIIFSKWRLLKSAMSENTTFLKVFWNAKNIDEIYEKTEKYDRSPIAAVFKSGFKELKKLSTADAKAIDSQGVDNINRALLRASTSEIAFLERYTNWLATTASGAPFVGLFGTVWGIMNSFHNIGASGAANLAVVAPGISEALIATAVGLAAAIPAVIAYNFFAGQIKRVAVDMDCFAQDFLNIIQRSLITNARKGS
jgi:biopolymer transport protein TolQ